MAYTFLCFHVITLLLCNRSLAIAQSLITSLNANHTDHLALLAIKSRITNDPQGILNTWNTSVHFCQWEGVTCGRRHNRVNILDLNSRGISGSLSPHIGNLSFLRRIRLHNNTFEGVIPHQIGGLLRLQELILSNNMFEGEIPASLSNCTRLTDLRVARNKLSGKLPHELSSLIKLTVLAIHVNSFTGGIPSFLGNLTSLEAISASDNHLGGSIPNALGQLNNLQQIGFSINQLSGIIPPSLYNVSSLLLVDFSGNQIVGGLPDDIGLKLPHLQSLILWGNQLTGTLPPSLSNCSNLVHLNLAENNFTGKIKMNFRQLPDFRFLGLFNNSFGSGEPDEMNFIVSMVNCSKLEMLLIHINQFRGMLPTSIGNLSSQLSVLSIAKNFIYGPLPSGIGNLLSLERLLVEMNQFIGVIPSALGNLQSLRLLYLDNNKFTGNIPASVGNLSLLNELLLQDNRLEGQVPSSLGNCKSLASLDLSANNLTGTIPIELFQLSSLSVSLNLAQNRLVGALPQEIGSLISLEKLDLSENQLVGAIPNTIGSCIGLEYLNMEGNSFQGSLPLSMSALRGIRDLDLSSNNFSGEVPRFLEQLNLSSLNLSYNNFHGEVPVGGVFKNATAFAIAGNNWLCGGLPELHLPNCSSQTSKKGQKMSRVTVIVISLCSFLVLAVALSLLFCWRRKRQAQPTESSLIQSLTMLFCWRRKRQAQPTESSLIQSLPRISYGSILKATNGFSEQNLIGIGSFSAVYKGILEPTGMTVAFKVLKLGNHGALKSFAAECEALRNIRHRNLVKVITSCTSVDFQGNDFKALVYEYMPNGNLESWLHPSPESEPKRLSIHQRTRITIDVVHALHYLHQECETPMIHCDLKPSNILLDGDMVAHVGDFGLARFLPLEPPSSNHSSSIGIRGTIGYTAPEYGVGSEMSRDGDVYSFGILLLEMITGKRPTDSLFQEGLNLHSYVKMGLEERIMEVVEPAVLTIYEEDMGLTVGVVGSMEEARKLKRLEEWLISLARVGVACCMESPRDRMELVNVIHEIHRITRENFVLQTNNRGGGAVG